MFNKILVPVDFSHKSHHALGAASKIAAISSAELDIFHIVQSALMVKIGEDGEYESLGKTGQQKLSEVVADNKTRIEKLADKYRSDDCKINTRIKVDELPDKVAEHIHQENYDLLVIGGDLDHPMYQLISHMHLEKIVRLAKKPVLVMNQPAEDFNVKRIVVPTNLVDQYGRQIEVLKQIQSFFDAHIEFLYINTPAEFLSSYQIDDLIRNFQNNYQFENCDYTVISDKNHKKGLLKAAKYLNADMLGLLSFQNSELMRFFRGDVTEYLVKESDIPLMVMNVEH